VTIASKLRAALPWLGLGGAVAAVVGYAYPGLMTPTSLGALRQARSDFYDDSYAPAVSALWCVVDAVVAGPVGMFALHAAILAVACAAILRHAFTPRGALWATAGLLVFPPILASLAVVADGAIAAAWLALGAAALLRARASAAARTQPWLLALLPLFVATALDRGALVATLPLLLLLGRRRVLALGAWLVITLAAFGANALLARPSPNLWSSTRAAHDIVGTLRFAPGLVDEDLRPLLADTDLRTDTWIQRKAGLLYDPGDPSPPTGRATAITVSIGDVRVVMWRFPADGSAPPDAQRVALARAARQLAFAHPTAYLQHRRAVLANVLWVAARHPGGVAPPATSMRALADDAPIFAPWMYLVLALGLLPVVRRHRDVLALFASGIASVLALAFAATSVDYYQTLWLVTATCLGTLLVIARRARAQPAGGFASDV
jgi:hypothetical protein